MNLVRRAQRGAQAATGSRRTARLRRCPPPEERLLRRRSLTVRCRADETAASQLASSTPPGRAKSPATIGRMEGHQAGRIAEVCQQRGHIAAAREDLRIRANQVQIEMRQQVVAAVPSARAENSLHLGPREHLVQLVHPPLDRSSEVQVALEDRRQVKRLISQAQQVRATGLELIAPKTSWRAR